MVTSVHVVLRRSLVLYSKLAEAGKLFGHGSLISKFETSFPMFASVNIGCSGSLKQYLV